MPTFRADVYSWISQQDVPNPIAALPGGVARWGSGACGPRFGGDGFIQPPISHEGWKAKTFRAMQTLAFSVSSFGERPSTLIDTGVIPGLTTVLTKPRSEGGRLCTSLTLVVTTSESDVSWDSSEQWYEMRLHGSAHDPIPEAALKYFAGKGGEKLGRLFTPDLEWRLAIRIQKGTVQSRLTRLRYGIADLINLDTSDRIAAPQNLGGTENLVHGLAYVRRFPSYVVYLSASGDDKAPRSLPIYFSDASERSLAEIVVGQQDAIRQITW